MKDFPKWKFHATEPARVIESKDEETTLGGDWFDTPAEAEAQRVQQGSKATEGADRKTDQDNEVTEEERLKLLEIAKELGLKPHPNTGAAKLLDAIDKKRAETSE